MGKTCKLAGQDGEGHALVNGQDHAGQMPQNWSDVQAYWHWSRSGYWYCQVDDLPGWAGGYYWLDGKLGQWSWRSMASLVLHRSSL